MRMSPILGFFFILWVFSAASSASAEVLRREAKETLTAIEMNQGDKLQFRLRDGRTFRMSLQETSAAIVEEVKPGGIVYRFSAHVRVDSQPMVMERYVCSQECFYEPYVINGVRIWLDIVSDVFELIPVRYPQDGNLRCRPRKDARFAMQEADLRICPDLLRPWIDDDRDQLDVGQCYNGDDCYLGPYLGEACHVGMDINHAKGSPLFAPLAFETHAYFNSLAMGDNNNRWRGIRRWANGDVWALQTHHLIELLASENQCLPAGAKYATTAGVHVGSHQHTHFEFKVATAVTPPAGLANEALIAWPIDFDDDSPGRDASPQVLHLDPWIIFWQIFEDRKRLRGEPRPAMNPLASSQTGEMVELWDRSAIRESESEREVYWTFGDGGFAASSPRTSHVFARPGVYPVTLTVQEAGGLCSTTQHVVVSGEPLNTPVLALASDDEVSFRPRPVPAMDVYGEPVHRTPHTLHFVATATRHRPATKGVQLCNLGGGELTPATVDVRYLFGKGWAEIKTTGKGNLQELTVAVNASGLGPGDYSARIEVTAADALNGRQPFFLALSVVAETPPATVTVDDRDPGFYATPWFWVGHRFCRCPADRRGHHGFYLTNGGRAVAGEFARFTPALHAGRYMVSFNPGTPFPPETQFNVRVRHAKGEDVIRMKPAESRIIGTWDFDEGVDGYVQIEAENSRGVVIADAITFKAE